MSKIIELCKYRKNRRENHTGKKPDNHPVWFYELNEGIKNLSFKNQEIILSSVKENLSKSYYIKLKELNISEKQYSIDSYLYNHLDLSKPFSIPHGVQFLKNYYLSMISDHDWHNITDIIIRFSLNSYFQIIDSDQPFTLVDDYSWTSIIIDIPLSNK